MRTDRRDRRLRGKSDTLDAENAARAVLSGGATAIPKTNDGTVEMIRQIKVAKDVAVKGRTSAIISLKSVIINADPELREQLQDLPRTTLIERCAGLRPGQVTTVVAATKHTLRSITRRWQQLNAEVSEHEKILTKLTRQLVPDLVAPHGVGPDTAAEMLIVAGDNADRVRSEPAWARLLGVAPIPASSGMTTRHRLNRGGHRQANAALYRSVIVRMQFHKPTKIYVTRRTTEGKTKREIIRCLKRLLAREIWTLMRPFREAATATRIVLRHPEDRVLLPARLAHPGPRSTRGRRLDRRPVQPPTTTLSPRPDQPRPVRTATLHPHRGRSTSRITVCPPNGVRATQRLPGPRARATPAAPAPWPPPTPERSDGHAPTRTDQRTSHPGTTAPAARTEIRTRCPAATDAPQQTEHPSDPAVADQIPAHPDPPGPALQLAPGHTHYSAVSSVSARSRTALVTWLSSPSGPSSSTPSSLRPSQQLIGQLGIDQRRSIRRQTVRLAGHDLSVCHRVVPSESLGLRVRPRHLHIRSDTP